jgi:hypothetical protein
MAIRTAKQKAALRKAQLASARKRKMLAKSGKKLQKKRGIKEYKDRSGRSTGWATNKRARTNWGAMRNVRKAARYNKKLGKKMKKAGIAKTGYYGY